MSGRKAFLLEIEIEIHSIDSRKTKLSQFGNVALSIHTLSSNAVTMRAYPHFPIHFHEKLVFKKIFNKITDLSEIQDCLNKEFLKMELIQSSNHCANKPTIVAYFQTKLSKVLFPKLLNRNMIDDGRIKLLMEPTEKLKGGIGPEVEVSTKITIKEKPNSNIKIRIPDSVMLNSKHSNDYCWKMNEVIPENISCSVDCCVCKSYLCYFDKKQCFESCCCVKNRFSFKHSGKPISYRQFFYENLDFFYRQLRHMKDKMILNDI